MDILKPELLWIGNCCYRVPETDESRRREIAEIKPVDECAEDYFECGDGPCDMDTSKVQSLGDGRFMLCIDVPKGFWGHIIGMKGMTRRRIEEETSTKISVPKPTQVGEISIVGNSMQTVLAAQSRIELIVRDARQKIPYTHFLSIPAGDEVLHNFLIFKEKAQNMCPEISDDYFTSSAKLHLTLNCLLLMDGLEVKLACKIFNELKPVILEKLSGKKLTVPVRGIDIMNDDPSKTRVLFAKVNSPLLQEIANEALSRYSDSNFVKDRERDCVKLHLTLINVKHVENLQRGNEGPRRGYRNTPRLEMDVRPILRELKDFYFGVIPVNTIHLSTMGELGDDGYYYPCTTMTL